MFGSPILHALSQKIGRKPIYLIAFIVYIVTDFGLAMASVDRFGDFTLGWIYIMRAIQGFFAIAQPMGFTIISDVVPPENRAFAVAFNNLVFMFATLVVTVLNAFVLPHIPGAYPQDDNYIIHRSSQLSAAVFFAIGTIFIFFFKESCPNVLLRREYARCGKKYVEPKNAQISWGNAIKMLFGHGRMICLFISYVFGFGTAVSNQNVVSFIIANFMDMRNALDSYVMVSIMSLIGIGLMLLFTVTCYKPLLRKFGDTRVLMCVLVLSMITAILRSSPAPLPRV